MKMKFEDQDNPFLEPENRPVPIVERERKRNYPQEIRLHTWMLPDDLKALLTEIQKKKHEVLKLENEFRQKISERLNRK